MHVVMGLDISTKTGAVVLNDAGVAVAKVITFTKERGLRRVQLIAQSIMNIVEEQEPQIILIEGFAQGTHKNVSSFVVGVEITTMIKMGLFLRKIPWYTVPPTTVKKETTGKGNAKKPDMAAAVAERWGFVSDSDDVVDAHALAQMAWRINMAQGMPCDWKGLEYHVA